MTVIREKTMEAIDKTKYFVQSGNMKRMVFAYDEKAALIFSLIKEFEECMPFLGNMILVSTRGFAGEDDYLPRDERDLLVYTSQAMKYLDKELGLAV